MDGPRVPDRNACPVLLSSGRVENHVDRLVAGDHCEVGTALDATWSRVYNALAHQEGGHTMEETSKASGVGDRILGTATIWRLAQIVLILAAAYLYLLIPSFGGVLQGQRITSEPHTANLLKLAGIGVGIGLCIGLALKDFSKGRIAFAPDWPTFILNMVGAGIFVVVSVALDVVALNNSVLARGPYKDAVIIAPLLPFVWAGLALMALVRPKLPPPPSAEDAARPPADDSLVTMAP